MSAIFESMVHAGDIYTDLCVDLAKWSQATFGSDAERGPIAPLKHLATEVDEAIADSANPVEYADCLLLVIDAARRAGVGGIDLLEAARNKLRVNEQRAWPKPTSATEPVFHVHEGNE